MTDPARQQSGIPLRALVPNAVTALALCFGLTGVRFGITGEWPQALACNAYELRSPSVQLRVLPGGTPLVLSPHSQVLGGPNRQVYLGCRFPADKAYRGQIRAAAERVGRVLAARGVIGYFGVDFFVVPDGRRDRVFLAEINLRVGGTTHPFGMASLVTEGRYDPAGGHLVAAGRAKSYLATDNLKSASLVGRQPQEVIDRVARLGLAYDARRRTGATMHLLGALREYGKMGVTCIGDTEEEARERYREVVAALT